MRLEISAQALRDMELIHQHGISQFGVARAAKYMVGLLDLFDIVLTTPQMARERPEFIKPTRVVRYKSHMVFYRTEDEAVMIIRILHGKQDWLEFL